MEQQNQVPVDIARRRILANILRIPHVLLGLASLEDVTYQSPTYKQTQQVPALLQHTPLTELEAYEQYVRDRWLLSYTGEEMLDDLVSRILELELLEEKSSGELQRHSWRILNAYYQLASDVARHQGMFSHAHNYADHAVRVARLLHYNDFLATALYRRGYTALEWATLGDTIIFGKMNSTPDKQKLISALSDFEEAMPQARPQLKGAILLEMSRTQALLQQRSLSLSLVHEAQNMVDAGKKLADPLEQILRDGALNGLNEGMYLLGKAASFIVLGKTTTAIALLDDLEELKPGKSIPRNQARRLAYADLLRAEASLGTRDYFTAATRATNAFQTFSDIQTIEKIARIIALHKKLEAKSGSLQEVKYLGQLLSAYYKQTAKKGNTTTNVVSGKTS